MSESMAPTGATDATIALESLPLRPELVGQVPYGAPQLDIAVRLNVNENPYAPSRRVRNQMAEAIGKLSKDFNRYPDREALALRRALADYLGFNLEPENIWVANGSNEIMTHLLGAFGGPGRKVLTFGPTYSMYPEYARNTHTEFVEVPRLADFTLDAATMLTAINEHAPDLVLITSPNNPTGTLTPIADIAEVCENSSCIVIVDEAYQEFTEFPEDSALALLPNYGRLVVSRTLSKAFAFAGGRLGYLAAAPAIVDACRIVRLPYHLSTATQALALVALRHADKMLSRVNELRDACQELQDWLGSQGLDVIPSQANFCLFGKFADRHEVWSQLCERGVLVREVGPQGYLRVSAGTPEEMTAFKEAMTEILPSAGVEPGASARLVRGNDE